MRTCSVRVSGAAAVIGYTKGAICCSGSRLLPSSSWLLPMSEMLSMIPHFGLTTSQIESLLVQDHGDGVPIPRCGIISLSRVLRSVRHVLDVSYAPLLPDLTAVLLNFMPEPYAYSAVREMIDDSVRYIPVTQHEHRGACRTFADVLRMMHPSIATEMERCRALTVKGFDPIFRRFFTTLLRYADVMRIMDVYLLEGIEFLFRIGLALIVGSRSTCIEVREREPDMGAEGRDDGVQRKLYVRYLRMIFCALEGDLLVAKLP